MSLAPVSIVITRFPPLSVTASLNVTVTEICSPIPYVPFALSDSILVIVGLTPSITIAWLAAILSPVKVKSFAALYPRSMMLPDDIAIVLIVRSFVTAPSGTTQLKALVETREP